MPRKKAKPRNPQDITLRNIRAADKRLTKLEKEVAKLKVLVNRLSGDKRSPSDLY
jgi:hypothetical protein